MPASAAIRSATACSKRRSAAALDDSFPQTCARGWKRRLSPSSALRPLAVSKRPLTLATLVLGLFVPRAASAVQSAELYGTQAYFYGRFEARVQFAPGEGVVSSFFLWKDGSSSTRVEPLSVTKAAASKQ